MTHITEMMRLYCYSVGKELGYSIDGTRDDALGFVSGNRFDEQVGMDLARWVQATGRDTLYAVWPYLYNAVAPSEYVFALRTADHVHIVRNCSFYADDDRAPMVVFARDRDEHFVVSNQFNLEPRKGKPGRRMITGERAALKRIHEATQYIRFASSREHPDFPLSGTWAPQLVLATEPVVRVR